VHTFISNNNLLLNNEEGDYHDVSSENDIYEDPLFADSHSTLNHWYHIVGSYDDTTETFKIYIDGQEQASEQIAGFGSVGVNDDNMLLGGYRAIAYWLTGRQDDIAIWNRALSGGEVTTLYNNGTPETLEGSLMSGLQAYYRMENNWNDSSGNNHDVEEYTAGFTTEALNGNYAGLFTGDDGALYSTSLATDNGITISTWVYRTNLESLHQTILNKGNQSNNNHIWMYFTKESIRFELGNGVDRYTLEANVINPWDMDFHLKSEVGRWDGSSWVMDIETSPCIDAGTISSDFENEPTPNGGKVNIGAYGNSVEASKSVLIGLLDALENNWVLYPNPTTTSVYVSHKYVGLAYEVIATNGKVLKKEVLNSVEINVSEFKPGIYFVKLFDSDFQKSTVLRMIVE